MNPVINCQHIDQIEQNRAAGSQTGGDSVSEFLYTFRRGGFFFHTTSLPLVVASREAERPLLDAQGIANLQRCNHFKDHVGSTT
jgi:hypothetical protein